MFKLVIWRYRLDPSSFVWPVSEVVPHYRFVIVLSACVSTTIPFCCTPSILLDIFVNYKVAITLNNQRVVSVFISTCARCPHGLTICAVHYQISIVLHDKTFRLSFINVRHCCPNVVNKAIFVLF